MSYLASWTKIIVIIPSKRGNTRRWCEPKGEVTWHNLWHTVGPLLALSTS